MLYFNLQIKGVNGKRVLKISFKQKLKSTKYLWSSVSRNLNRCPDEVRANTFTISNNFRAFNLYWYLSLGNYFLTKKYSNQPPLKFTVKEFKLMSGRGACKTRFTISNNQGGCGAHSTPVDEDFNHTTFSWVNKCMPITKFSNLK